MSQGERGEEGRRDEEGGMKEEGRKEGNMMAEGRRDEEGGRERGGRRDEDGKGGLAICIIPVQRSSRDDDRTPALLRKLDAICELHNR